MIGIFDFVYSAVYRAHVCRMKDMIDPEPEKILVISNPRAATGFGKSVRQVP